MIRRLFPERPDLFPAYTRDTDNPVEVLGVFGTAASYSGWKQFGPSAQFDSLRANLVAIRTSTAADLSVVRDTAIRNSHRIDTVERDVRTNLYIACELLRRSQPGAIPPEECSDAAQRSRRATR